MPLPERDESRGAPRRRWPAALAVLATAAIALVALGGGDAGDDAGPVPGGTLRDDTGQTRGVRDSGAGRMWGTLSANGLLLLGAPREAFDRALGHEATGRGVRVLSAAPGGFFVGETAGSRVYVRLGSGPDAQAPRPGSRIDLVGRMRRAGDVRRLGLEPGDARTVQRQGAFVAAAIVSSGSDDRPS